jgi:hypothetical protein
MTQKEENNHIASEYKRVSEDILEKEPDIMHDLLVIKTYSRMVHDATLALEAKLGSWLKREEET